MRSFFIFCWLIILLSGKGYGQAKDSLFLYNGQVLIGEIQSLQLGVITIDDRDLKMQDVKSYKIKRLITNRRFKIETDDKKVYYGLLREGVKAGWVDIVADQQGPVAIDITRLHAVIPLEKSFFSQLSGTLSAGFSYTKSSSIGQINLSSSIQYAARRFEYQFSASANASIDSTKFSRDREDLSLMAIYYMTSAWFVAAGGNYQRNLELSIARRFQEIAGAGNKVFVKKNWQLLAISGIAFNQEKSTDDVSSKLLLEIPVQLRYNFFRFQHPNIQISSSQSAYFSLTQKGRVRYEGNTSFSWEVVRYFYLTLNPYTNFDNQPPSGSSTFDYGAVFSLSYKF